MSEEKKEMITETTQQLEVEQNKEKESHSHHSHRHNHSHHHHSHHRSHGSSKSKKWRRIKRFFRKNKKRLMNVLVCALFVSALVLLAIRQDATIGNQAQSSNHIDITDSTIRIESTLFMEKPSVVAQGVLEYMAEDNTLDAELFYKNVKDKIQYNRVAVPVEYTYNVSGLPANVAVVGGVMEVAEEGDFTKALQFSVASQSSKVEMLNLKAGTRYEYRLTLSLSNHTSAGTLGEFTTQKSPRFLQVDGLRNVRDVGGWTTQSGKVVKQGMLYRGIELDGAVESTFRVSPAGVSTMVDTLGIRYDMDLRSSTVNVNKTDALGETVVHKYYPVSYYADFFNPADKETVRKIFSDLSNKNNYPVYMHCTYGRDRTGTVCYLLQGLLGVSKEDASKEYSLTVFSGLNIDKQGFAKLEAAVEDFRGSTFQEKVENYLISIGVTRGEINSIREIFLGE